MDMSTENVFIDLYLTFLITIAIIIIVGLCYWIYEKQWKNNYCKHDWKIISNENYWNTPWRYYEQITVVQCKKCSKVKHIRSKG